MADARLGQVLRHARRLAGESVSTTSSELLERFAARHDEEAFAALVRRHGPLVLGVCRRTLRHEQDAEDAFQATFLVLAQRAASIRKRESLVSWLHGVAYHMAAKARRSATTRQAHECQVPAPREHPPFDLALRELQAILDEEIAGLPEAYRAPFVLCCVDGQSKAEAARELGWKEGTVSGRLARARKYLQERLASRGVSLSAAMAAAALARDAAAGVRAPLLSSTVKAAVLYAAHGPLTTAAVSPDVAALAKGVTESMFSTKAKTATAILLSAAMAAGILAVSHHAFARWQGDPLPVDTQPPGATPAEPKPGDAVVVSGWVVGPDGKPFAGAALYDTTGPEVRGRTDAAGRFHFTIPRSKASADLTVVARADGHGPAWAKVAGEGELTLRLAKDDVPVTGRVLDLQGKPVAGLTLRVAQIKASPDESLTAFVEALQARTNAEYPLMHHTLRIEPGTPVPNFSARTDEHGRFRLDGVGRERLALVVIEGPAVATRMVRILTRPGASFQVPRHVPDNGTVMAYSGPGGDHAVAPNRPVTGVVRDRETKKPVAGARVEASALANMPMEHGLSVDAVTDDQGRFRLTGMPKGQGNMIRVVPPLDLPYLFSGAEVGDPPGFDPVEVPVELTRGVWVRGRVTDKGTGRPVPATVEYFANFDNPRLEETPGFGRANQPAAVRAGEDGSFRVAALPGPGFIAVKGAGVYIAAHERDKHPAEDMKVRRTDSPVMIVASPRSIFMSLYHCVVQVDPPAEGPEVKLDVDLEPGQTLRGTVLGPDGKPLSGAVAYGLGNSASWDQSPLPGAGFTLHSFNPRRPRVVLFRHPEKGLAARAQVPETSSDPFEVRLQPAGTITGRVVDADGQPRPGLQMLVYWRHEAWNVWIPASVETARTDTDGRFRIEGVIPGLAYEMGYFRARVQGLSVEKPGETRDFGDVKVVR